MSDKVNRRRFLKGTGALVAGSAIATAAPGLSRASSFGRDVGGSHTLALVRPDPEPYKVDSRVYKRFSAGMTCFNRAFSGDPVFLPLGERGKITNARMEAGDPGFSPIDIAFQKAAQVLGDTISFSGSAYDYRLETVGYSFADAEPTPIMGMPKYEVKDPAKMSKVVKKVAKFLGASLAGICNFDRRWLYSEAYCRDTNECIPLELPEYYKYAVVMAFEQDYDATVTSPTYVSAATVAMGYSNMDRVAMSLATFIKNLGYHAIAAGNDTALSVPMAIDAGLGEFSRSGLLVTPQYGPRVRLAKVITDMPLAPDQPITFGVREFCRSCKKCATHCPANCIPDADEPTWAPAKESKSNNPGVYKWYLEMEKCLLFWATNGANCTNCVAVCPYNKPSGMWHHTLGASVAPTLGKLWVSLDDALGYGEQRDPEAYWDNELR